MSKYRGAKRLGPVFIWAALCACQLLSSAGLSQPTPTAVPPTVAPATPTLPPAPTASPAPSPTLPPPEPTATTAPKSVTSVRLAVRAPDNTVQIMDTHYAFDPAVALGLNGLLPSGGVALTTVYALDFSNQTKAVAVEAGGNRVLSFVQNPNYALAVWPGGASAAPLLAWGTQPSGDNFNTSLIVSGVDGANLETLLSEPGNTSGPHQLVAERWSADGKSLYFSREPVGIGGYIVFSGASSLYRMEVASRQVTELIPFNVQQDRHLICLDALSADDRLVADHCADKVITVRDLTAGQATTIQPPQGVTGFGVLGSARFSPDGSRVAFALAKGDPSAEQGWVAVSQGLSGASQVVLTGQPGEYFLVDGWLNSQTMLVESNNNQCTTACTTVLLAAPIDGSSTTKLGEGTFLALANGPQP